MEQPRTSTDVRGEPPYLSLRLWGDGDEIDAISDVERAFGIKLDYADAANWWTVGDVYRSLLKVLPANADQYADTWVKLTNAIVDCVGLDPTRVAPETTLIERNNLLRYWWQSLRKLLSR